MNQRLGAVLQAQSGRMRAQVAAFYHRIDSFITPILVGGTTIIDEDDGDVITVPLAVYTQADANLRGIEGQVEAVVAHHLVLGAMGDLVRGDFRDGGPPPFPPLVRIDGGPLPFMPAARIGGSARWDDGRYLLGAEVRRAFAQERVPENELATGSYTRINLSAGLIRIAGGWMHSITLRADNLLDEEYRNAASRIKAFAPNPGRNLTLVYRLLF